MIPNFLFIPVLIVLGSMCLYEAAVLLLTYTSGLSTDLTLSVIAQKRPDLGMGFAVLISASVGAIVFHLLQMAGIKTG